MVKSWHICYKLVKIDNFRRKLVKLMRFENVSFSTNIGEIEEQSFFENVPCPTTIGEILWKLVKLRRIPFFENCEFSTKNCEIEAHSFFWNWTIPDENWPLDSRSRSTSTSRSRIWPWILFQYSIQILFHTNLASGF